MQVISLSDLWSKGSFGKRRLPGGRPALISWECEHELVGPCPEIGRRTLEDAPDIVLARLSMTMSWEDLGIVQAVPPPPHVHAGAGDGTVVAAAGEASARGPMREAAAAGSVVPNSAVEGTHEVALTREGRSAAQEEMDGLWKGRMREFEVWKAEEVTRPYKARPTAGPCLAL